MLIETYRGWGIFRVSRGIVIELDERREAFSTVEEARAEIDAQIRLGARDEA